MIFGGFAMIAYLNYGRNLKSFHTLGWSFDTCFRLMLGDVEPYDQILTTANSMSGVIFYYVSISLVQ
jgi:hypothetical protein